MNFKGILTILMVCLSAFALWFAFNPHFFQKPASNTVITHATDSESTMTQLQPPRALIDFSLIDSEGKPFDKTALQGHWTLLFFGYATCPGICPHTLRILKTVWTEGKLDQKLQFIFVTLNAKKDSPENLKAFLSQFNPHFKGLTGDMKTIEALSKNCSIYYFDDPKAKQTFIDHSATLLLINPKAELQALFSPPHEAQKLLTALKQILKD